MDDIIAIAQLEKQARHRQLAICAGFVALGIGIALYPFPVRYAGAQWVLWAGSALLVGLGAAFAGYLLRIGPWKRPSLADTLLQSPRKIVWVYPYILQTMPFGVAVAQKATLYCHTDEGKALTLRVNQRSVDDLMKQLKQRLPHATFGYSEEKAFLYQTDPRLLIDT